MHVVMVGPFGLKTKSTMRERALPMAKALVKRGYQVTLIIPPWDSPEDAQSTWHEEGVHIINTALPTAKGLRFYIQLTKWMVNLTLSLNPDIVHIFKPKAYAGLVHTYLHYARLYRQYSFKLVVDEDDWERAWNEKNNYSRLQKLLFAWQEPWGLKHADRITVASKALYQKVAELGVPRYKICYVPNGLRPMPKQLPQLKTFNSWQEELTLVTTSNQACYGLPLQRFEPSPLRDFPDTSDYQGKIRAKYNLFGKSVILVYHPLCRI